MYLNAHTVRRVTVKRSAGEKIESKFVSGVFLPWPEAVGAHCVFRGVQPSDNSRPRARTVLSPNAHSNVNEGPSFAKERFPPDLFTNIKITQQIIE